MRIIIFCMTILFSLNACAMGNRPFSGPHTVYENLTNKPIKPIKVQFESFTPSLQEIWLGPGQSIYSTNYIISKDDIYGDIVVGWKNAEGKEYTKRFKLTEQDLPREYIDSKKLDDFIVLEFTQNDVKYYTSAAPDCWERGKKSSAIMNEIRYQIDKASRGQ
jgi:hypothetical protein